MQVTKRNRTRVVRKSISFFQELKIYISLLLFSIVFHWYQSTWFNNPQLSQTEYDIMVLEKLFRSTYDLIILSKKNHWVDGVWIYETGRIQMDLSLISMSDGRAVLCHCWILCCILTADPAKHATPKTAEEHIPLAWASLADNMWQG